MKYTHKKLQSLRAGDTVWRTLIWFNPDSTPWVDIQQVLLQGTKKREILFKNHEGYLKVGNNFLGDLQGSGCFSSYRGAIKFKEGVEIQGFHKKEVIMRESTLNGWDEWEYEYDDYEKG